MNEAPGPRLDDPIGRLIEVLAIQAEASRRLVDLIESRSLPLLERIAIALEQAPLASTRRDGNAPGGGRGLVDFRLALQESRWDEADAIARDLALEHPDDASLASLVEEVESHRQTTAAGLRQRIEAAQRANDPGGAITSRDDLAKVVRGEEIRAVDRSLVKWLMTLIQRRLRTGTIQADVVALAARVAESFGGTTEGASLRASLPTLRRSAGLCPRCAEPYTGVDDACPKCLAAAKAPTTTEIAPQDTPVASTPEPEPDDEDIRDPIDLNDERLWTDL